MDRCWVKFVSTASALFFGSGLASVYALEQEDFTNTGLVFPASTQFENNSSNNSGTVLVVPKGMTVQKRADTSALSDPMMAGDVINYDISLTNDALLGLTDVSVSDSIVAAENVVLASGDLDGDLVLDAGEVWVFAASYTITQDDIDTNGGGDGAIENVVSVTTGELEPVTDSANVAVVQAPLLTVEKTVDRESVSGPVDLNYRIEVVNTGNQSLSGVSLADTLPDGSPGILEGPDTDSGLAGVLDVGETWAYSLAYTVSQAELDAGLPLVNSVDVTSDQTGSVSYADTATTTIDARPALQVAKQVDVPAIDAPGTLNYTVTVENSGNVTLTDPAYLDTLPDGSEGVLIGPEGDGATVGALDVGEIWTYTASYAVSQQEIDAGTDLENSVSFTSVELGFAEVTDTVVTTIDSVPQFTVAKTVDATSLDAPGDLAYVIELENTGNVSLSGLDVVDTLPDGSTAELVGPVADTGTPDVLDVGESWQFTAGYSVSQAELDLGDVLINSVSVASTQTGDVIVSDTAQTTLVQSPTFTVTKEADLDSLSAPGVINYEIQVTNTGNVSLTDVVATDTLPGGAIADLLGPATDTGIPGLLDVGETWTYAAGYTATQADIDAGAALVNSVLVTTDEAGSQETSATTTVSQLPGISLDKSTPTDSYTAAGDEIRYDFVVTNTGNVALTAITVADQLVDDGRVTCNEEAPSGLAPAQQLSCTATLTIDADDVARTEVINRATAAASEPDGNSVEASSNEVVVTMLRVPPVATDDVFESAESAVAVLLPGASNDSDSNGDIDVTTAALLSANATDTDADGDTDQLIVAGQGTWQIDPDSGEVTFSPLAGFTADPDSVVYTVRDATGLVSNEATLTVGYPQTAPVAQNDFKQSLLPPSASNPVAIEVLADNGDGPDTDPEGDIDVQSVAFISADAVDTDGDGDTDSLSVAGEGVWSIDNATGVVTFTPLDDFKADPTPVSYTVSDINGLVSNPALITVDYPQTAPLANDDERLDLPLARPVTVAVLDNDTDPESNLDPATVMLIDSESGEPVTTLVVEGEGAWAVDAVTGAITFTPEAGFVQSPTPIGYTVADTTGLTSNTATVTLIFEEPVTIDGVIWLDANSDGVINADEDRKVGWTVEVSDLAGNLLGTAVTDEQGEFVIAGLVPGEYRIALFNPGGVLIDERFSDGVVSAGETVRIPLALQPTGIVYDSVSRVPVAGVTLNMLNSEGQLLDPACLLDNQQSQVTEADGLYAFDFQLDTHPSCVSGDDFRIEIAQAPEEYRPAYSSLLSQVGAEQCGDATLGCAVSGVFQGAANESFCTVDSVPGSNACEVQLQASVPSDVQDTRYFVEFSLDAGDNSVIHNHLPIDSRDNDASILLSKSADRGSVSTGGLVEYTVTAENAVDAPLARIVITDNPPASFSLADGSVRLTRAGNDGELDTDDDVVTRFEPDGQNPIVLGNLDFAPLETLRFTYILRVGVGVVSGDYANKAMATGPAGAASNIVSAVVEVVPDPVLQQATLVGKVFHDRDRDGTQDPAVAHDVRLGSDYFGWQSLELGSIPGRANVGDDPAENARVIYMPVSDDNAFSVTTAEGTRIRVDNDGNTTEAHVGEKARGLTGQDLRVCVVPTMGIPTGTNGESTGTGVQTDVLKIVVQNYGVQEEGIPGARLATVTGLLVQTDAHGRYNIPDVDAGSTGIGQNFALKVDPRTLPEGSTFTTDNPYVLRILSESLNKINFGVAIPEVDRHAGQPSELCALPNAAATRQIVEVSLGSVFFDTDGFEVRDDQRGIVLDIVNKLRDYGGGRILVEAHADSSGSAAHNLALARKRANTVRRILRDALGEQLMHTVQVDVDPDAYREQAK